MQHNTVTPRRMAAFINAVESLIFRRLQFQIDISRQAAEGAIDGYRAFRKKRAAE